MRLLKADTEAVVRIGPCVDISDGFTMLATLDISTADYAYLSESDGTETDISGNTWAAVTGMTGWYDLTLTAAQLNTEGETIVAIYDVSLCLPIHAVFQVVPANVYDSLIAGTDVMDTSVTQWLGQAVAPVSVNGVPEVDVTHIAGSTTSVSTLATSVAAIETDTDTTIPGLIGTAQADLDTITGAAGALIDVGTGAGQINISSGAVPVSDKTGFRLSSTGVDDIWDENLSGHVAAGSAGAANYIIRSNTCQSGSTSTSVVLDASASSDDDFYIGAKIYITSGTAAGQSSYITDYTQSTKTVDIEDTWVTSAVSGDTYVIVPGGSIPGATAPSAATVAAAVWNSVSASYVTEGTMGAILFSPHSGTSQTATSTSITLDATGSSATTDFYKYSTVKILSGTAAGQERQITAYNGSTKVATVSLDWIDTPTANDYIILPFALDAATVNAIADAVWDEPRDDHQVASTMGQYVRSDALRISGSASAADGLEAAVAGSTPLPSNITRWLGTAVTATVAGKPEVDISHVGGSAEDLPTATALTTMQGNVTDILTDTGTTIPAQINTLIGTPGSDLATEIAAIKVVADAVETDTQNIQSRLPATLNNGAIQADIQRINDVAVIGDGSGTPFTV